MVTTALALYLKWARQHPGNTTEYKTRDQYDVTSSILGTAPAPIHCHVFAESPFWFGLQHLVVIFLGNVYSFLFNQLETIVNKFAYSLSR